MGNADITKEKAKLRRRGIDSLFIYLQKSTTWNRKLELSSKNLVLSSPKIIIIAIL